MPLIPYHSGSSSKASGESPRLARRLCVPKRGVFPILVLAIFLTSASASASDGKTEDRASSTSREEAARAKAREEFARGVEHFKQSQFEPAARAFLRADASDPDSDALSNALIAAQKSGQHLLVVDVAKRAFARPGIESALIARAREALANAARHLALLRVSCAPSPCIVEVDGKSAGDSEIYVHPGTRRMIARDSRTSESKNGVRDAAWGPLPPLERMGVVEAGTTYEFHFDLEEERKNSTAKATSAGHVERGKDASVRETGSSDESVFFSASAVTLGLGAAVLVSGLDAMDARNRLTDSPSQLEIEEVRSRIVRTDVLVGTTVAAGVFSLAWGILATDFVLSPKNASVAVVPEGFFGSVGGTF